MKKFSQFILEDSSGILKDLDPEQAKRDYDYQIKDALNSPSRLYRGMYGADISGHPYILGNASRFRNIGGRVSLGGGNNVINWLMSSVLPSWNDYPKRTESFICSVNEEVAGSYGDTYLAIPLDNQKIGLCPRSDIYISFGPTLNNLGLDSTPQLERAFHVMSQRATRVEGNPISIPYTENQFHNTLQEISNLFERKIFPLTNEELNAYMKAFFDGPQRDSFETREAWRLLENLWDHNKDKQLGFIELLDELFLPEKNKFQLMPYNTYKKTNIGNDEMEPEAWFTGPALFVLNRPLTTDEVDY